MGRAKEVSVHIHGHVRVHFHISTHIHTYIHTHYKFIPVLPNSNLLPQVNSSFLPVHICKFLSPTGRTWLPFLASMYPVSYRCCCCACRMFSSSTQALIPCLGPLWLFSPKFPCPFDMTLICCCCFLNFLFGNKFRLTESLPKREQDIPHTLHTDFLNVIVALCLLFTYSVCVCVCIMFSEPFESNL